MSRPDDMPPIALTTIMISGPDAIGFMQSQLTLDVENIDDSQLHPAAWCSPDGRVDVVLLVALEDQRVTLVLPEGLAAPTFKRARMYSIGRKVDIANGPGIRGDGQAGGAGYRALALSCDAERALVLAEPESPGPAGTPESGAWPLPIDWLQADIDCGLPWILPQTAGMFLPQMLGLEALGGLSYQKGCFPGQEVIARVHYRGRVKRRIARFRLQSDRPPAPGTGFELADKPACVLYSVASADSDQAFDGLAVVSADADAGAQIRIADATGCLAERLC